MKVKILSALIVFSFAASVHAQKIKLVLTKGEKYKMVSTVSLTTNASVMGQEMENIANTVTSTTYEVKNVGKKQIDLASTITWIKASVQAMGQEMSYDSDKKDNSEPLAEEMGKKIGKPRMATINTNGKILKQDKDENNDVTYINTEESSLFLVSVIGRNLTTGTTWMDSTKSASEKVKSTTTGTYTVIKIENGIATIEFDGTQKTSGIIEQQGQEMNMTGSNTVTATYAVSISTGIIQTAVTKVEGTNSVETMGMTIPVTVKSSTNVTIQKL